MYLRCGGELSNNKIACLENPYLSSVNCGFQPAQA